MTDVRTGAGGALVLESSGYRLEVAGDGTLATLASPEGRRWASLRLLAALDRTGQTDETLEVEPPRLVGGREPVIEIGRRSTCWSRAGVTLTCADDRVELVAWVEGAGRLAGIHLLGGRSLLPGRAQGFLPSGSELRTLFSPNPGDPGRLVRGAGEPAVIGVVGDSEPGRGHWFFTPAPLYLALTDVDVRDPATPVERGWLGLGIEAPLGELTFEELRYAPADRGFSLLLDYAGHTVVDGRFAAPPVVLTPGVPDPYAGLRRHRSALVARGAAPAPASRETPEWWSEPIFCGWGAQCHLAASGRGRAADFSTQESYDAFLAQLEARGVMPGTVVIDDKWQEAYGTCVPDRAKWPDLAGWIAERHARGQRVLLWWKAWDPEGLPAELCIRNAAGAPIALDPTNPAAREALEQAVAEMLGPAGADADGLKVDFTAAGPSGASVTPHGDAWGIALLHELLLLVYVAAKELKPEALVSTHSPHPSFVDVTDMIRLNDMLRLADGGPRPAVAPQMRFRAEVVRSTCPELLVDTDDWCVPDKAAWREFLEVKPELGVPSLYYATHLDLSGEALDEDDYAALRRSWARWRASRPAEAAVGER